ncbi:glycogen synthase [Rhizobium sp. Leaf384]|uniref:glycogen synthase GlgA n=1 Tax=unclassified Rhizobium TaxID=2613769 RepID=UPI000715C3CE|nr:MULTISPECIES: glycogen synthase GlgA [unclassified Rhizobium]KQS76541.1 glycogen synthase [Rhizobium sp. Leaf383]KQS77810.1 glycogen synthase [Rhizobium sp. Leaf384]
MNVLSVASEVFPLIKTGGLADVAGALPAALKPHGIRMRTLLPGYPAVMEKIGVTTRVGGFDTLFGHPAAVLAVDHEGLDLLVLDAPALFDRPGGPYLDPQGLDHPDNFRRFAALSLAAAEIARGILPDWTPDLVHCHDWQAALAPVYMNRGGATHVPTVLTIHNIAFRGQFPASSFPELALPWDAFSVHGVEYYGDVSFLKGGLMAATAITTVSPSYAQEILTPEFGMGLQGVLAARIADLHGIVNGIDTDVWNPETDPHIASPYAAGGLKKRQANRDALRARFGLTATDGPLFCVVSRLTDQKGMDVLAGVIDMIVENGATLAVLGSGDPALEAAFRTAAAVHPGRVGLVTGYDEPLSHLMQAGADAILVPSRFEPCGLTQLYGLRYGCVPVVARTGGLADTIIDANEAAVAANVATGFLFSPVSEESLRRALRRVFSLWRQPKIWARLQMRGMKSDVSWDMSATRYAALYAGLLSKG